jgi:hypothetical protein
MTDTCTIVRKEHGVSTVVAMSLKDDPSMKLVALGRCYDCYNLHAPYMVKDAVWLQAWPEYTAVRSKLQSLFPAKVHLNLCLNCLVLRLGRDLTLEDLTNKPVNDSIVLGYTMGRAFERGLAR